MYLNGNDELINEIWRSKNDAERELVKLKQQLDDIKFTIYEFRNPDDIDHEELILAIRSLKDDSRLYENLTQNLYE